MPRAVFVGSYPPRECGIATFTEDVRAAYDRRAQTESPVVAITDAYRSYDYPSEVVGQIHRDDLRSYFDAAELVNALPVDVVNVQHEYGLFGGERGRYLIDFLARLRKPAVVTLHTTLPNPDLQMLAVTRELCNRSDVVVALADSGKRLLTDAYGIDERKVEVVLHGAPGVPMCSTHRYKRQFGLAGKIVIGTFGLISRGKGIEYIIDSLPPVFAAHPAAVYVLCGKTHPEVWKREGETYRDSLRARSEELGIAEKVHFINHYMSDDEVVQRLCATDVYVSPSLDPHQVVSGTLSYAVATGRPVIATEYAYAKELLADGRGITVPFRDAGALAAATMAVLDDGRLRRSMARAAYRYGRRMTWPLVARGYEEVFVGAMLNSRRGVPATFGAMYPEQAVIGAK
jgi:glycosyltransferase involved in cell wall biosynthesis